ncbi:IS66 family insertion sequence element accessory protein TnpB [Psychrobium sp. nBUS_13]|uniref:IS66 family insertion sequence element accessory protein TnpB n=1 Tax=Psychrobium sp. nBUS_13 TaxID=3395319 RepID=UPI003EBE74EC
MFTSLPEVFLYRDFVDFGKSINGLSVIIEQQMQLSPLTGSGYVLCNKGRDKHKKLGRKRPSFRASLADLNAFLFDLIQPAALAHIF